MNLAELLLEDDCYRPALLLGEMAVTVMLRAICLKQKGVLTLSYFGLDDLLDFIDQDSRLELGQILFINSLSYFSQEENMTTMDRKQVKRMLRRVDECLAHFP